MEFAFAVLTLLSAAGLILLRHSFFAVPLVVFLSLWVQDFFPLSHFPMYSDPDEKEDYFYLAELHDDGEWEALPVRGLTNITAPKVKKMFKAWADKEADARGVSRNDLSEAERAAIGERLLAFLADQARDRGNEFPPVVALIRVWIVYDDENGVTETPELVASIASAIEPAAPTAARP